MYMDKDGPKGRQGTGYSFLWLFLGLLILANILLFFVLGRKQEEIKQLESNEQNLTPQKSAWRRNSHSGQKELTVDFASRGEFSRQLVKDCLTHEDLAEVELVEGEIMTADGKMKNAKLVTQAVKDGKNAYAWLLNHLAGQQKLSLEVNPSGFTGREAMKQIFGNGAKFSVTLILEKISPQDPDFGSMYAQLINQVNACGNFTELGGFLVEGKVDSYSQPIFPSTLKFYD